MQVSNLYAKFDNFERKQKISRKDYTRVPLYCKFSLEQAVYKKISLNEF